MLTELELIHLRAARDLITPKDQWCQGEFGYLMHTFEDGSEESFPTDAMDTRTSKVCALGAVRIWVDMQSLSDPDSNELWLAVTEALNNKALEMYPEYTEQLTVGSDPVPIVWVNDRMGHEAVLQVFDKVLADNGAL